MNVPHHEFTVQLYGYSNEEAKRIIDRVKGLLNNYNYAISVLWEISREVVDP